MILLTVLVSLLQEPQTFTSQEHGFKIAPPKGWKVDDTPRGPCVVSFEYTQGTDRAEINVYDLHMENPITIAQFKSELGEHLKEKYKEHHIASEQIGSPRSTFVVDAISKEGQEIQLIKTVWTRGFRHWYVVDSAFFKSCRDTVEPVAKRALESFQLLDTPAPLEFLKFLPTLKEELKKLSTAPPDIKYEQLMNLAISTRVIGSYSLKIHKAELEGHAGYAYETCVKIDQADAGKTERSGNGFIALDLHVQTSELDETTLTDKGRQFRNRVSVALRGTAAEGDGEINGEKVHVKVKVPEGTILMDSLDVIQFLLADRGKASYAINTLSPYDDDVERVTLETSEKQKATLEGKERGLYFIFLCKEGKSTITYTYAEDKSILQVKSPKQPIEIRARK